MKDFVTFEQAHKLKELGFNWECISYYNEDERFIISKHFRDFSNCKEGAISVPTLSQAQKWLREVKGFVILVGIATNKETIITNKPYYAKYFDCKLIFRGISKYSYATYEEALSAGIDKALELLKGE